MNTIQAQFAMLRLRFGDFNQIDTPRYRLSSICVEQYDLHKKKAITCLPKQYSLQQYFRNTDYGLLDGRDTKLISYHLTELNKELASGIEVTETKRGEWSGLGQ